jgi:hypothetical protein
VLISGIIGFALGWWCDALSFRLRPAQPYAKGWHAALFFIVLFAVVILAAGQSFDWFPAGFYKLKGFLLSARMLALVGGFILGFWSRRRREKITARGHEFYAALLGTEQQKSSWVLQSAVAIFGVLAVILALKPDLLDQIETIKAGQVEAKFATVSTTTREAALTLSDLTKQVTVEQWIDFNLRFGPREDALEFDHSEIKDLRKDIRNKLFDNYVKPLAILLGCLKVAGRLDEVKSGDRLTTLAVSLRNGILYDEYDSDDAAILDKWQKLFDLMSDEIVELSKRVEDEVPQSIQRRCKKYDRKTIKDISKPQTPQAEEATPEAELTIKSIRETAKNKETVTRKNVNDLLPLIHKALAKLKEAAQERTYKLSYIDPYVVAAISDLVALTLGLNEKANFLAQVKDKYPTEPEFIQPGLINLYYQMTDAKVKVQTSWPPDDTIAELGQAMNGANFFIAQSRQKMKETTSLLIGGIKYFAVKKL